jgi:regulator of protease activity HflC (stomatin/prohibitin superfamily)
MTFRRRNFFTIIQQGTKGVRLFLGSNPKLLEPGINIKIPFLHKLQNVDMRETAIPIGLPKQCKKMFLENDKEFKKRRDYENHNTKKLQCFTSDNVPVDISGSLFYQIKDAFKSCFNINNSEERVADIGTSAMRSIIGTFEYDEIISDRNKLNIRLREVIGDSIKEWGIDCTRFEIQSFEPSNSNIRKQLELQMEAERERRKNLLDTEAQVTVSDGIRRKTILESEGKLQAQINYAKGEYERVVKEAESHKISLQLEAEGLKQQIETISESVGDSYKAVKMMLEIKRMEQFKAIACGKNNTIYFSQDKNLTNGYMTDFMEKTKTQIKN